MATIATQHTGGPIERPAQGQPPVIEMQGVSVRFGEQVGVDDMTLSVPPGVIFGLIGPSGSGKTTTVRLLTGVYKPQSGSLRVLGHTPARNNVRLREQIGYVPQLFTLYPNLTAWENLNFIASLYGLNYFKRGDRLEALLDFVELRPARGRLGRDLSGGMQRRLALACALVHDPSLIFADEPTAGIDPVLRARFWEFFRQLRDQGRTLVVTTQVVSEAAYCDYVAVMRQGRILVVDSPTGLRRRVLGGEIIDITLADPDDLRRALAVLLRWREVVKDARRAPGSETDIHVVVDDAREWLPELIKRLENQRPRIVVSGGAPLEISYDEVFIRVMQAEEASDG